MKIRNCQLLGLRPEVLPGMICSILHLHSCGEVFILDAVSNGPHKPGSLHYSGTAFDFDLERATEERMFELVGELEEILGDEYEVAYRGTHMHIHWRPHTGVNRT